MPRFTNAFVSIIVIGDQKVSFDFEVGARAVSPKIRAATLTYGQLLLTQIQRNASGRPGPNVITGDYRRSWQMTTKGRGATTSVEVWTDAPQFRRLEYGFHGVDSLGRHYDQPPFPHVGPAVDLIAPRYVGALEDVVARLI